MRHLLVSHWSNVTFFIQEALVCVSFTYTRQSFVSLWRSVAISIHETLIWVPLKEPDIPYTRGVHLCPLQVAWHSLYTRHSFEPRWCSVVFSIHEALTCVQMKARTKSFKIPKGQSESVYRTTDNTMVKRKSTKDKQRSTKHAYKTKHPVIRTPIKTGGELRCSGRVGSSLVIPVVLI